MEKRKEQAWGGGGCGRSLGGGQARPDRKRERDGLGTRVRFQPLLTDISHSRFSSNPG